MPALILLLLEALLAPAPPPAPAGVPATEGVEEFRLQSGRLTAFWGRPIEIVAGVVRPVDERVGERLPVCYSVHGFGGDHREAWYRGPGLVSAMRDDGYPRMVYVFLNARCPMGHHEFADSVNNGPWGAALTEEFIPALEARFAPGTTASDRFLTGHSSGGWSSLWLQVNHPDAFAGTWSTAPDPVDFRDFTGIDIYRFENAFVDPEGAEIPLVRRGDRWLRTIREFVAGERRTHPLGGQFYSFNAVFSPRAMDGAPQRLFDWESGEIDREVAQAWRRYDIRLLLHERWSELRVRLAGKLHIYVGTQDTYRLEGAVRLLAEELRALGSDAEVLFIEGRDHSSLFAPHPEHWPRGLLTHIHERMRAAYDARQAALTPGR